MNYITFSFLLIFILTYFSPRVMTQFTPYFLLLLIFHRFSNKRYLSAPEEIKYIFYLFIVSLLSLFLNNFYPLNFIIGWYTLLSGFIILILAYSFYREIDIYKISKIYVYISVVEVFLGIFQVMKVTNTYNIINLIIQSFSFHQFGSSGDFFTGSYFSPGKTSNILGIRLVFALFLVICLEFFLKKKFIKNSLIFLFLLGIHISQNFHVTLAFILSLFLYLTYFYLKTKNLKSFIILIIIFTPIVISIFESSLFEYPKIIFRNINKIQSLNYFEYNQAPRKILAFLETIYHIFNTHILNSIIGIGIGNFSSYAALTGNLGIMENKLYQLDYPKEFWTIIYPKWNLILLQDPYKHGMANQPWSSFQSILGEFGLIGFSIFIVFWKKIFGKMNRFFRMELNESIKSIIKFCLLSTIFMIIILLFDNYLEDPRITVIYFTYLGYSLAYIKNFNT
jgi:hypothetical protein